jgi:alpha-2-macroglobulin
MGAVSGDFAAESAPPPPPAPAPMPVAPVAEAVTVTASAPQMKDAAQQNQMQVEVRSDFRSTAFWKPDVVTGTDGTATVKVKFPEALTTWRATARAVTMATQVGMGSDTARTNLPLIVRLQAPRFFVVGDKATLSAVINNNTDAPMSVTPSIEVKGLTLTDATRAAITVPPHAEARADWTVSAGVAGPATIRVTGRGTEHGDAMEKSFVVYEHGIDKLVARSGKLRASEALVRLELPKARRATQLVVNVTPTLAQTMIDALPYLIEFPYGCTEQTMSRFLPAAVVAKTGLATGVKNLDAVTSQGMARLYDMQHEDGGWGWWKEGPSDDFMTAYVVWGFSIARDAGLPVRAQAVDRGAAYLQQRLVQNDRQWNDLAWMLHALSAWRKAPADPERRFFDKVWTNREHLSAYSRALLALTAHRYGNAERAKILIRNLEDGVKVDNTPDQSVLIRGEGSTAETMATAHWGADRFWWRWHEGPIETTAFALQAMVTIQPDHRLIEPAMNWLVKNRRGAQWTNTRDTAIAVLALNDYLKVTGELRGDVTWEVAVNGQVLGTGSAERKFAVDAALLRDTTQEIRIRRTAGTGAVYFAAEARFVSLEEPVKAAGNELFVRRDYYRLAPKPTLLKGVVYDKVPLRDGESVKSGERVEVVVSVETKNDYSYLIFEDLKPAGLEAVSLQSGEMLWAAEKNGQRSMFVYQELRDRKVALFADHLPQGIWEIRYTLRAEVPGAFHALPVLGWAMYVPDIRANGDEVRVRVEE